VSYLDALLYGALGALGFMGGVFLIGYGVGWLSEHWKEW